MFQTLLAILFLSMASASLTVTLSRGKIFDRPRDWMARKSEFIGRLLSCPYCLSHWVAFAIVGVYRPQALPAQPMVNFFAVSFAVVTLTALLIGAVFASFQHIPAPYVEEELEDPEET